MKSPEDTTSFYLPGVLDRRGPVIWVGVARSGLDQAPDGRILTAYKAAYPLLFQMDQPGGADRHQIGIMWGQVAPIIPIWDLIGPIGSLAWCHCGASWIKVQLKPQNAKNGNWIQLFLTK